MTRLRARSRSEARHEVRADERVKAARKRRTRERLLLEPLESRTLLSVTAILNSGVLDVDLSSANDHALITPSGSTISVSGTGLTAHSFPGVTAILVQGANTSTQDIPNQAVTFGGTGATLTLHSATGADALSVFGVTSVTITDVTIDATKGDVDIEASETTTATNSALPTAVSVTNAAITVTGAAITADNITLDASAVSNYTYAAPLGGNLSAAGVAAAIADLQPSATVTVTGSATKIAVNKTSGNVTIGAASTTTVDSEPTVGKKVNGTALDPVDAAIAESVVNSSAVAQVGGGATVGAGSSTGTLSITSTNTTDVTTDVDGAGALGGAAAAVTLDNSTSQAFVNGGSTVTGGTVNVAATTVNTAETSSESTGRGAGLNAAIKNILEGQVDPAFLDKALKSNPVTTSPALTAVSGGLPISVAGAVAVTKFTPTTQAFVDSSTVTAKHSINISTSADNNSTTDADASTTTASADNSVGVAVAINDTVASNTATVQSTTGPASLTASTINVAATAPTADDDDVHDQSASATSGVSGENVGVVGGLALNIVSNTTEATVPSGSTVSTVGDVTFNAQDSVTETATAQPPDGEIGGDAEGALGVGAGVALNIDSNTTLAKLMDSAQLTGAHNLTFTADSLDTVSTNADSGSSGGSASISPSVAISVVTNTTQAEVGAPDAANDTLTVGGALSATATHTATTATSTGANAGDGGDFSAGVSIALGFVTDLTNATTGRSINAQGGGVTFESDGSAASLVSSSASADGGSSDDSSGSVDAQNSQQRSYANSMGTLTDAKGNPVSAGSTSNSAATPSAQTSDGSVTLAAAVAVNIVDSEATATIPDGLTITATGPLVVSASNDTGSIDNVVFGDTANAWGTDAGEAKVGVGAAVGLNLVKDLTQATIGASTIKADGVTVNAGMSADNPVNSFSANATSGAGASNVGISGALAINIVTDTSQALIETGASVAAGGGDVNVTSQNASTDLTFAVPAGAADGDSLGVGASVALNIITNDTESRIENGAALTGAGNVAVTADSNHVITTWGQNGASGGVATAGGVAVAIASDATTARIGSDAKTLNATGGLTLQATAAFSVNSLADSAADPSGSVGLGASVVVNVTSDAVLADLDRSVTAGGPVSITGVSTSSSQAASIASEQGAGKSDKSADQQSQGQFSSAMGAGGSNSPNVQAPQSSNSQMTSPSSLASSKSGGSSGQTKTGIAAAVAVNVLNVSTVAEIENNVAVTSNTGALTVGTTNESSALALADGRAVINQTSIGAAVSLNIANVTNTATIGTSDKISAVGVNVTALMPAPVGAPQLNDFSTQGLGVALGSQTAVAGSAGINVIKITTTASIGVGTTVMSFGGLNVQAANDETFQDIAFTLAATSGKAGAGAAVNVNVLTNPTNAFLDSNVQANVADATQVTAESSVTPSQDPIPNSTSDTLVATGTLTKGSPIVTGLNAAVVNVLGGSTNTPFVGEPVTGDGIPAGTVVLLNHTTDFTGVMTFGSDEILSDDNTLALQLGDTVSGPGIIPGATIVKIEFTLDEGTRITLSAPVFAGGANPLSATTLVLSAAATASGPVVLTPTPIAELTTELSSLHPTNFAAGIGAAAGGNGVAGSFSVNVIDQTTHAFINTSDAINTLVGTAGFPKAKADEGVTVSATETMSIVDWDGAIGAGGGDVGAGAALDVNITTEDDQAYIAADSVVDAAGNVEVEASETGSYQSITAAAGIGGSTAIAGAASIEVLSPTTNAYIDHDTTVDSKGTVLVVAGRFADINTLAGQVGLGGKNSVGAAVSTVVDTVNTDAYIGADDSIAALGTSGTVLILNPSVPGTFAPFTGVAVLASTPQNLQTIAVGGSVAGAIGAAGSGSINVLSDTTLADIGAGATITAADGKPGKGPGVIVAALDPLTILSTAGAFAGGGSAGLGAGVDVDSITKNTQAFIATANVTADGDVQVAASSSESLTSITASVGISGNVAVAGSAGVYVLGITTRAVIGDDPSNPTAGATNIQAAGSILVSASEQTSLDLLSGDFGAAGETSVGAAAGVPVITKTTEAFVGAGANVAARGLGGAIQADDGRFDISYAPYGTAVGVVQPVWQNSNLGGNSGTSLTPTLSPRLGEERIATPETTSINGLAVTAVNSDAIQGVGVDGGVSGSVAVNLSGSVGVLNNTTDAYIGAGAVVNSSNAGAASNQAVLVASGNDTSFLGIAAALSVSGEVSITPGVVVIVLNNTVVAAIDDGASVTAAGDIAVQAHSSGDVLSIAASGAVAGEVGVGGAVSYVGVNDTTQAYIGDTATTDAKGAHANAGGNVLVDATDDTVAYMVTGSLGVGVGTAGIGGGVGIALLNKNTDAFIGTHATVNALGNSASLSGIFSDAMSGPTSFETLASFHGVAVQAATSENVTNIAVAGGVGFYAGLAGGVSVEIFQSSTQAYINSNANINESSTGASTAQAVDVAAVNQATNFSFAGAIAGSIIAALAGGVDVGLMKNSTVAYIGTGADVRANQDVDVFALSNDAVQTYALGVGAAAVALEASVSVWSIGVAYDAGYSYADGNPSDGISGQGLPTNSLSGSSAYTEGSTGGASSLIGSLTDPTNNGAAGNTQFLTGNVGSAQGGVTGSISSNDPVTAAVNSKAAPRGTMAFISSNVTVTSGGSVNVQAKSLVSYNGVVGGLAAGIVGLGASVEIANIQGNTQAFIDTGSTVSAGGNVSVGATLVTDHSNGLAFAGTGGIVAVGAQVVDIQDTSTVFATVNDGAAISRAQLVDVAATSNRSLNAQATGGSIAGIAAGAGVAIADARGSTVARIGSGAQVGQTGTVGSVDVAANANDSATANASAVTGGVGAVAVNVADAEVTPLVQASIGTNAAITVGQNVSVTTGSQESSNANIAGVQVAGLAVGVSLANATLDPTILAFIDSGSHVVSTGGAVTVSAVHVTTTGAQAGGTASAVAGASGQGSNISATSTAGVSSFIGGGAIVSAPGTVSITAAGTDIANADAETLSVGITFNVAAVFATATASGVDSASLGAGAVVGTATRKDGGLVVTATGTDQSSATTDLSGGGIFSGEGGNATATTDPTLNAYLDDSSAVNVTGNILVQSNATTQGDASSSGATGGIVDVGESLANSAVNPTLNTYIGTNANVIAGGSLTVQSLNGAAAAPVLIGGFTASQVSNNQITISQSAALGLEDSEAVTYSQNGNPPIGGLTDGRSYDLVNPIYFGGDTDSWYLGGVFSGAEVNTINDTILLPGPGIGLGDNLQSGDEVIYENADPLNPGNTTIPGLVQGATYVVRAIGANVIKLVDPSTLNPDGSLPSPTSFDPSTTVSDNTINLPGFTDGQAVTYSAPSPVQVPAQQISDSTFDLGTDDSGNPLADNFTDGEAVNYVLPSGATPIGGLTSGDTYYIITISSNQFQVSATPGGAPITLTVPESAAGVNIFDPVDEQPIGGLASGQTYYVINATATGFQLSETAPDPNKTSNPIKLKAAGITGVHTIGVEGVDFTGTPSGGTDSTVDGDAWLILKLNPAGGGGTYQLLPHNSDVNGLFNTISAGAANATAVGSGGGLVQVGGSDAVATSSPTVATYVGAGTHITAGGNVSVTSTSSANTSADGTNTDGGLITVGGGTANVTIVHQNSATVGGEAVITTTGSFTLEATSINTVVASSDSAGGGAVAIADANTTVTVDPETQANVGAGAEITAGTSILVESQTDTRANNVRSSADGSGLGVNATTTTDLHMGAIDGDVTQAYSETTIAAGAGLLAKDATVQAVTSYFMESSANSSSSAFAAKGESTATTDVNDTAHVAIMPGATITGTDSVDIEARHDDSVVDAEADTQTDVAFGQGFATSNLNVVGPSLADASQPDETQVDGAATATIVTPNLQVKALNTIFDGQLSSAHGGFIVGHYSYIHGQTLANRTIHWNSDVVSGGGGADTTLIVNANGTIDPSSTITPTITPTQIIVPNIDNAGVTGSILFQTISPLVLSGDVTSNGTIDGSLGTFYYSTAASSVELLNNSTKDMVVNDIDLAGAISGAPHVNVEIDVENDVLPSDNFAFNVVTAAAPTLVDIENQSTTGSPNIILSGFIDNPVGTTKIIDARGSIQSTGQRAVVLTNVLDAEAPKGQIGALANMFQTDLVESESASGVLRPVGLTVLAGGDAYLDITGFLRDPDFNLTTTPFVVPLGSIQAGGNLVIFLQESVQESAPGTSIGGIIVFEDATNTLTSVSTHFRPGTGIGPAEVPDPGYFDSNDTLIDSTYNFENLTAGGNIQLIGIPTATTESGSLVTPIISLTGFTNINPKASSTGQFSASTNGDINFTETTGALRVGGITSTGGNVTLTVPNNDATGDNLLLTSSSSVSAVNGFVILLAADNITIPSGSTVTAGTTVIVAGDDGKSAGVTGSIISISGQIFARVADISGGPDDDVISLTNVTPGTVTTVSTLGGVDTVNVGSIPPPEPNKGVLDNVQGPLTIRGTGVDTLNVDDTGSTAAKTGTLTATALTGLNMDASGIAYSGIANLNIDLGSGGNTFLIADTADGTNTSLNSGKGADTVNVRATTGPTTVNTGGGTNKNVVNVGSLEPAVGGFIGPIKGALIVAGNGHDTMNVDDTGSTVAKTGTLTATTLTGLNMGVGGITYGGLVALNISLGSGINVFTVADTAVGTTTVLNSGAGKDTVDITTTSSPLTVNTQAGTDTVNVQGIGAVASINAGGGNDTINVSSDAPTDTGTLSGIDAVLTVNGGTGSTTTNVSDTGDTAPSTSTLTATKLTSTAFGAGGSLSYASLAALDISMGSGGNTFLITNTAAGTDTSLDSGTGADTVNVRATTGPTTVDTGGGTNENVVNVGSLEPAIGGFIGPIKGALDVIGNGADTMNVDDTGSTVTKTGTLTATALTGLNMGPRGITYGGLSALNISLGSGVNTFLVSNTAAGTNTFLDSGKGVDTVNVDATTGPLTVNTGGGTNKNTVNVGSLEPAVGGFIGPIKGALDVIGNGHDTMNVDDTGSTVDKTGTLTATTLTGLNMGPAGITYGGLTALNISLGSGVNVFTVADTAAGTTTVLNSGAGKDTVDITTTSSPLTVNTQAGTDTVNVQGIGAAASINAGGGNDTINVSSDAPTDTGTLSGIAAVLTVNGGTGSTTTNVGDTGDTAASTSTLTATKLTSTAFGAGGSLVYSSLGALNISMGSGGNTFLISNTATGTTTFLDSGTGKDTVNVRADSSFTTVDTGGGTNANVVNVGSKAPATGGDLSLIARRLTVIGDSADTMNADDTGDTVAEAGTLTATALTGLTPATDGIVYSGLAKLNIHLGTVADVFNVKSTAAGTTSTITTQATGNTWNVGSKAPTVTGGVLSGIQGPVVIDGGGSKTALTDTITFDDSGSTNPSEFGDLTDKTLTGLGMGAGVTFVGQAVLNINLGNNGTDLQGFITNNLPATTNITGGSSDTDGFISSWAHNFNGTLNLLHIGDPELDVTGQLNGHLNATAPAYIDSLIVGGSVNVGSSIGADQIDSLFIGVNLDINLTLPGIAGAPAGTDALGNATIGGSLPEGITLTAASVGSLAAGTNAALAAGHHNLAGIVDVTPGSLGSLTTGPDGSITTTGQVNVTGDLGTITMLGAQPDVGQVMAGVIDVGGTLGTATIAGGTPGLFIAGHVGTIGAYGGFGPIVLRVIEAGVQRWLEEDPAGQVFSQPNAAATATTPGHPNYINTQYFYESAGFTSPQISARITNGVGASPDQFDFSTVVFQDGASFNLDRLDASGVSGIRNVAVEGSLVTALSTAAESFFLETDGSPDPSPTGVYLPADDLASVSVRDYAPASSIVAAEIQAVAFGSFTNAGGVIVPGSTATGTDASGLLGGGTKIVPAGSTNGGGTETFRVPFAALAGQQSAFFLDTAASGGAFDPNNVVFTLQSDSDGNGNVTLFPATRGAVTALIGVQQQPAGSVVQSVDLYGDGGSIFSEQFIAQSITSTGPLGDLTVLAPQGLNNVTAPSIFGNIAASGPLFGTIQTTGIRTDPVTGATSVIPADLGRAYVDRPTGRSTQPFITTTTIEGQGADSFTGRIISRGNLISSIRSDGGASGVIAAQGSFGAMSSLLGTPTRVGGLLVNGGFSGQLVVLGNDYGDLTFHGGLTGGRIAVEGTGGVQSGILGNVIVDRGMYPTGTIGAGSAIVSGGEIGDATLGTALSVTDNNDGIVAAIGQVRLGNGSLGGYVFNDVGATPADPDAAAIDAIFTDGGQSLGLDLPNEPLGGLAAILEDLAALSVDPDNGDLVGPQS